ncbi:MAG: tol-pal system protein YbgF [Desulfuromonadales bacterium]
MISRNEKAAFFILLTTFLLAACAAPQTPPPRSLDPVQAQRLADRQEELSAELTQVRDELDEIHATLEDQGESIAKLERREPAEVEPEGDEKEAAAEALLDLSPTEVYRKSFAAYAAGDYANAIEGFELFVENFPGSRYAGNAYYWLGESHFSREDYSEAISAFRKLAENFPKNSKVPEALFKVAQSYNRMDQPEQAEQIMELLGERFPESQAAQRPLESGNH